MLMKSIFSSFHSGDRKLTLSQVIISLTKVKQYPNPPYTTLSGGYLDPFKLTHTRI